MSTSHLKTIALSVAFLTLLPFTPVWAQSNITPAEAPTIAKEAYIYGFPMMDSYRIMHACFVGRAHLEYKAKVERSRNENQ